MNLKISLPILIAILCGLQFPFFALQLMPLSVFFLAALMFLAIFDSDFSAFSRKQIMKWPMALGLFSIFVFFPMVQFALAKILLQDDLIVLGVLASSLAPTALVSPFLTRRQGGNTFLSLALVMSSTFLFPAVWYFGFSKLNPESYTAATPFTLVTILIMVLPLSVHFMFKKYFVKTHSLIFKFKEELNILFLALLIFVLFGVGKMRLNSHWVSDSQIMICLVLVFFQDFGVYIWSKLLFREHFDKKEVEAIAVSVSCKNTALVASLLLYFFPFKLAVAPILSFVAHAFHFGFLGRKKTDL